MPAASFSELYNFPGNLSAAAKAILIADVATLIGSDTSAVSPDFIFGPRENEAMRANVIELAATMFTQASDQQIQATSDANWYFCHYSGQISFSVITPRGVAEAMAEHGKRVGRIMFLMTPIAARFDATTLPHYEILVLRLASIPQIMPDADRDADRTDITYNAEIWIKPGAFPAIAG